MYFEFSKFWISEEPESVMQFGPVRDKFAEMMTGFLKDRNVVLELKYNSVMADEASIASVSTLDAEWLI